MSKKNSKQEIEEWKLFGIPSSKFESLLMKKIGKKISQSFTEVSNILVS